MPETPVQDATRGVTATGRATGLVPPDAPPAYHRLLERLGQVSDLHAATTLLNWDEEVNMPPGGAAARAEQKATLNRLAHEAFTAPEVGQWLDELAGWEAQLDPESDAAALLRVTRRDYERARRVPPDLVAELARASSQGYQAWVEARSQQRFAVFAPALARLLELRRQMADALGYPEERYDALLEGHEPGMRTRQVRELFARLKEGLVPLVQAIAERQDRVRDDFLHGDYPDAAQWEITLEALEAIGFDFQRGRQDRSIHPFTAPLATGDVRLTTRINPRVFGPAFFSSLHEGGHGLYEQGFPAAWHRTPLADGASSAVHESQSRLWENVIGRSREFWRFFFPRVQARFPQQLAGVDAEAMYRAVNRSRPSLIRVDADEVTYNLHIMLRFELELALLSGDLPVDDLPGAWREKTRAYLGSDRRTTWRACCRTSTGPGAASAISPAMPWATSSPCSSGRRPCGTNPACRKRSPAGGWAASCNGCGSTCTGTAPGTSLWNWCAGSRVPSSASSPSCATSAASTESSTGSDDGL